MDYNNRSCAWCKYFTECIKEKDYDLDPDGCEDYEDDE